MSSHLKIYTCLSFCVLLSWGAFPIQALAQGLVEFDILYAEGEKVPVAVATDRLGLVAREGVSAKELIGWGENLGLQFLDEIQETLFVFALPNATSRDGLLKLSREVEAKAGKVVREAGFIVTANNQSDPQLNPAVGPGPIAPMVVTDEFVVEFHEGTMREEIELLNAENGVKIVQQNPFVKNQFLMTVTEESGLDALSMANKYHESPITDYAHPNLILILEYRGIPNDPLFNNQWHHRNTGASGGAVDADADSDRAWDITTGGSDVLIAVIDGGFDATHPDLVANIWVNPLEIPGNRIDDDGNGFVDDINGWDFVGNDNTLAGNPHGTAVAGLAAAKGNNRLGVSGTCQDCGLMLLRVSLSPGVFTQGVAFDYARSKGADIITNSWGYQIGSIRTTNVVRAINRAANFGRGGLGCVVLFAMNNIVNNDCTGTNPDISSLASVIAVSRATNQDRFNAGGFGNCMDVLGPTAGRTSPAGGTLRVTTTDVQGSAGYNNSRLSSTCPSAEPAPPPANARDYTVCFNGTSAATPIVAGIAGLILDVYPGLTRLEVQRLLQDTADKVEDSVGRYSTINGFSRPASGTATHGYGRVNAYEAVRVAAPVEVGGGAGVDIFLRDNRLDWGNTEQPSNTLFEPTRGFIRHWASEDIKVDAPNPGYQPAPTTSADFDAFVDEKPIVGAVNRVYVRVRNRGPITASRVVVKVLWTQFGTALPRLPSDFWSAFPGDSVDTSQWRPLTCSTTSDSYCTLTNVEYSGSSVAGSATDGAQIAQFELSDLVFDATLANHFCITAMVDSPEDPIDLRDLVVDNLTPNDNNVTHRNYRDLDTRISRFFTERFFVRNPYDFPISAFLTLNAPKDWEVECSPFPSGQAFKLDREEEVLVEMRAALPAAGAGEIEIIQERADAKLREVMGGLVYRFSPGTTPLPTQFTRGDCNGDGVLEGMADAIFMISHLFLGGEAPSCKASCDCNADGHVEVADAICILSHIYLANPRVLAEPYAQCGLGTDSDYALGCDSYPACSVVECPDPAVQRIDFDLLAVSDFVGKIRVTGVVENIGGDYDSGVGQQEVLLLEVPIGGEPRIVARQPFEHLGSGERLEVVFEREWNASSPAEGEFPPLYRLQISYDPDLFIDGNPNNDDCDLDNAEMARSGSEINEMF